MGEKDKKSQPDEVDFESGKVEKKSFPETSSSAVSGYPGSWEEEGLKLIQSYSQELRGLWRSMANLLPHQKPQAKKEFLIKLSEVLRGIERLKGSARLTPYSVTNTLVPIEKRFLVLVERGPQGEFKDVDLVCALERVDFEFLEKQMGNLESVLAQGQVRGAVSGALSHSHRQNGSAGGNTEDWKMKKEFPYESAEEFWAIQEARKLFRESDMNSQVMGLRLLEERGLVANLAYDRIHQSGSHQFSGRGLDEPNPFAVRFAEQTGIGPKSVVLDTGCGMGSDSVHFAERGAKVIALDTSRFAQDQFKKNLERFHPELSSRIAFMCEDTRKALFSLLGSERVTHIYGHSSWHYDPPMMLKAKLKAAWNVLNRNREKGYLGVAIKTIESDSAKADRHYRLTMGDDLNYSMDKEDRILRLYPEEDMLPELVTQANFAPILLDVENVADYDKVGETEVFRLVIAKVPGAPHRRRRR